MRYGTWGRFVFRCFRGSFSLSAVFTCCENLFQSQVVSEPLTVNEALTGLVLGVLQVFGLRSAPLFVLANGAKVTDFTYCSEMKVSSLWLSTSSIRVIKILYVSSTSFPSCRFWKWPTWLCQCRRCWQSSGFSDALNCAWENTFQAPLWTSSLPSMRTFVQIRLVNSEQLVAKTITTTNIYFSIFINCA